MTSSVGTVAILWRDDGETPLTVTRNYGRLLPILDALGDAGVTVKPCLYSEATVQDVRTQLLEVDGVLVWVDPIADGERRADLDTLLRDVSSTGVWVSAHPDTIDRMGTKEVLYETRGLGWGADTALYSTPSDLRARFPDRLRSGEPRVLKQSRGNGGSGVWKVALVDDTGGAARPTLETRVRVQHAAPRDNSTEDVMLGAFLDRCDQYFAACCTIVDQPYARNIDRGMIRAYQVEDRVVGYARQQPATPTGPPDEMNVLGMPSAKTMSDADDPTLLGLRHHLEHEWIPELSATVGLDTADLPVLWDADFLYGTPASDEGDAYLLCEINVSSVLPFPPHAPHAMASAVAARLQQR